MPSSQARRRTAGEAIGLSPGARVGAHAVLGRGCQIESDARVEGAILWANCRVGQEAAVSGAIAGRHVHIGRGATVGEGALLGDKTSLTDYCKV